MESKIIEPQKLGKSVTVKKRKPCAKGTRRNKEGICVPNRNIKITTEEIVEKPLLINENKELPLVSTQLANIPKNTVC